MDPYLTTQIITYLGNKRKLLPTIKFVIETILANEKKTALCMGDGFSGSGIVSRLFKSYASELYTNDIADYSYILNQCYLANISPEMATELQRFITEANSYADDYTNPRNRFSIPEFICGNWAPKSENIELGERVYFTYENGKRIDILRNYIETLREPYKTLLLGRLLVEVSIHNNTNGQFSAYYKGEDQRGQYGGKHSIDLQRIAAPITLTMPISTFSKNDAFVSKQDTTEWARNLPPLDFMYYDPPYNKHPYSIYYFMLNIVAQWNTTIEIPDTTRGQPLNWHRSAYNSFKHASNEFETLISLTKARYILISYNSGGIIPINVMDAMLAKYGTVTKIPVEHKTYNRLKGISEYKRTTQKEAIKEFFWLLQKSS